MKMKERLNCLLRFRGDVVGDDVIAPIAHNDLISF